MSKTLINLPRKYDNEHYIIVDTLLLSRIAQCIAYYIVAHIFMLIKYP